MKQLPANLHELEISDWYVNIMDVSSGATISHNSNTPIQELNQRFASSNFPYYLHLDAYVY